MYDPIEIRKYIIDRNDICYSKVFKKDNNKSTITLVFKTKGYSLEFYDVADDEFENITCLLKTKSQLI